MDNRNLVAQFLKIVISDVNSVDVYRSFGHIVEPQKQRGKSRFTRAEVTYDGQGLVWLYSQVETSKYILLSRGVAEVQVAELNAPSEILDGTSLLWSISDFSSMIPKTVLAAYLAFEMLGICEIETPLPIAPTKTT